MTISIAALVAANLVPLGGALFLGWEVGPILLLYWSENLVVGGYNLLKILLRPAENPLVFLGRLFPAAFFCFHYGAFCGVHGLFLLVLADPSGDSENILAGENWPFFLVFMQILVETIHTVWQRHSAILIWPWVGLLISHGVSFVENFLCKKEYQQADLEKLMKQPYERIVLLHVVIIAGGVTVMRLGSPLLMLVLLIVGKIGFDIHMHRREHRPQQEHQDP